MVCTTRRLALSLVLLGLTGSFVTGCVDDSGDAPGGAAERPRATLPGFESEAAFEAYMSGLEPKAGGQGDPSIGVDAGFGGGEEDYAEGAGGSDESAGAAAEGGEPENENITNTQEVGIDEGGIVKNIGRFLVVLRHGRVHVMDTQAAGGPRQVDVADVAPTGDLDYGVWYDEMLVSGRELVVVGYRYASEVLDEREAPLPWIYGATELTRFTLADDGRLSRGASTWLESNDYYSGTNYASRLVDGEVLLYMPYGAFVWSGEDREIHRPRGLTHLGGGRFAAQGELFDWSDVVHGEVAPGWPVFHTVVRCPLSQVEGPAGGCRGKSLLADPGSTLYVSANAVYLWGAQVARLDLNTGDAALHAASGYATDQFAFKDTGDALHAVVVTDGPVAAPDAEPEVIEPDTANDAAWTPPTSTLRHLILPIADFDARGAQPIAERRQAVVGDVTNAWVDRQKYIGDRYLGATSEWSPDGTVAGRLLIQSMDGDLTHEIMVGGMVSRIESLGALGALVVWNDAEATMHLDVLPASDGGAPPALRAGYTIPTTAEGESRSHGFFYKAQAEGGGLFGLSVVGEWASPEAWYGGGVSNLAFFRAENDGGITPAGQVSAGLGDAVACEVSCMDWYGNTRPIFLGDRIFALMGDELAELARSAHGTLVETGARGHLRAE